MSPRATFLPTPPKIVRLSLQDAVMEALELIQNIGYGHCIQARQLDRALLHLQTNHPAVCVEMV